MAQRRGEVVILAGVVHVMRRPQQVALVARPVVARAEAECNITRDLQCDSKRKNGTAKPT